MTVLAPERPVAEVEGSMDRHHREWCSAHRALLGDIAEHDRTEAFKLAGCRTEIDYLKRAFGLEWRTARDCTRQATLIARHPDVGEAFAAGELSIDKLRSLAELLQTEEQSGPRCGPFDGPTDPPPPSPDPQPDPQPDPDSGPTPDPDPDGGTTEGLSAEELLEIAAALTAQQLAARAAAARREANEKAALRWRQRRLTVVRDEVTGRLIIGEGNLFDDQAALVWAAFEDYVKNVPVNPETGKRDPMKTRFADALVALATAYLQDRQRITDHSMVVFHADARLIAGEEGFAETSDHSPLSVAAVQRLTCFSKITLCADDPEGNPLNVGRSQRLASWPQARWSAGATAGAGDADRSSSSRSTTSTSGTRISDSPTSSTWPRAATRAITWCTTAGGR